MNTQNHWPSEDTARQKFRNSLAKLLPSICFAMLFIALFPGKAEPIEYVYAAIGGYFAFIFATIAHIGAGGLAGWVTGASDPFLRGLEGFSPRNVTTVTAMSFAFAAGYLVGNAQVEFVTDCVADFLPLINEEQLNYVIRVCKRQ